MHNLSFLSLSLAANMNVCQMIELNQNRPRLNDTGSDRFFPGRLDVSVAAISRSSGGDVAVAASGLSGADPE